MCTINVVAQAIYFTMILAGLTYSISSGFLVTDHLLDVNPCQAYASDDCLQYACQNYTSGELCPCYVDERECQYKSSSEYPLMPKACKALQGVDGSDLYGAHLRGSIVGSHAKGVGTLTHSTHSSPVLASEREAFRLSAPLRAPSAPAYSIRLGRIASRRVRVGCEINGRQTVLGGYF